MKLNNFIYITFLVILISCKTDKKDKIEKEETSKEVSIDKSELLLGSWKISTFINSDQVKKAYGDEMEEGLNAEFTVNGTIQFIKGSRYNEENEITYRLILDNQEIPLKFYLSESGTWSLFGNTIVTITEDSKIIPLDNATKNILVSSPEFKQMIEPNKGESVSFEIVTLTENTLQLISDDLPGVVLSYNKK